MIEGQPYKGGRGRGGGGKHHPHMEHLPEHICHHEQLQPTCIATATPHMQLQPTCTATPTHPHLHSGCGILDGYHVSCISAHKQGHVPHSTCHRCKARQMSIKG